MKAGPSGEATDVTDVGYSRRPASERPATEELGRLKQGQQLLEIAGRIEQLGVEDRIG